MKAKKVLESVNFERGQDPKDAMDLGMIGKIKNWVNSNYGVIPTENSTLLHYSILGDNLEFVKYLIEVKKTPIKEGLIDLSIKNKVSDDIIIYLIAGGDPKIINYLNNKKRRS